MCTPSALMHRFNKRILSFIKGNIHSLCIDAKVQQKNNSFIKGNVHSLCIDAKVHQKNTLIYKRKYTLPLH